MILVLDVDAVVSELKVANLGRVCLFGHQRDWFSEVSFRISAEIGRDGGACGRSQEIMNF